ncbi:MAG: hypothetical protein NTY80_00105 [candidate division SR1 bacterium]|nr:hypothetical protein [candidate division SR1 bacterium]
MNNTIQIFGDHLHVNLLAAITLTAKGIHLPPGSSFGINVTFIEEAKVKKGKLVLHTRSTRKEESKSITYFTGSIIVEKVSRPVIGWNYSDDSAISESFITIIDPVTEVFQTEMSKTNFVKEAIKYYKSQKMEYTKDGNLKDGLRLFRPINDKMFNEIIVGTGAHVQAEMHKNLFPFIRKIGNKEHVCYAEFIEEHLIRTVSVEEAKIRGFVLLGD